MVGLEIGEDDLLEVELEDGFVLRTTIDRLRDHTRRAGIQDRGDEGFPSDIPFRDLMAKGVSSPTASVW